MITSLRLSVSLLALAAVVALAPSSHAACSQPVSLEGEASLQDCLFIAKAAIGIESCAECVCDVNGSGSVRITDALRCLHFVLGADAALECPPCLGTTTTTIEPACASCREAYLGLADPEDLCEGARLLYDDVRSCPCSDCGDECLGIVCRTAWPEGAENGTSQGCLACLWDVCRSTTGLCLEN